MRVTILLCILVATSFALSAREQKLRSMTKLSYNSLFMEIQNQMKMNGPLTSILDTIEKFDRAIREEQAAHDAMWAQQSADCEAEIAFRNGEIQDGNDAYGRAEIHHATCSNSLARAEVDLETNLRDQADTQSALDQLTRIREEQNALFLAEEARCNTAISTLNDAMDFLDELVSGEGGLDELSGQTMLLIQTGALIHKMEHYAPIISLLAKMAADENDAFVQQAAVERVRGFMMECVSQVRLTLDEATALEAGRQEAYDVVSANLRATLNDLEELEMRLRGHIDEMGTCVLEEGLVMEAAEAKVARNTEMLDVATAMCHTFEVEYETATEGRNEERDLLRIIRVIAEERMVRYRDADTSSKYDAEGYGESYESMGYEAGSYTSTSGEWQ